MNVRSHGDIRELACEKRQGSRPAHRFEPMSNESTGVDDDNCAYYDLEERREDAHAGVRRVSDREGRTLRSEGAGGVGGRPPPGPDRGRLWERRQPQLLPPSFGLQAIKSRKVN